jgi:hypothetical protein
MSELGSKAEVSARRIDICLAPYERTSSGPPPKSAATGIQLISRSFRRCIVLCSSASTSCFRSTRALRRSRSAGPKDTLTYPLMPSPTFAHRSLLVGWLTEWGKHSESGPFMANLHSGDSPVLSVAIVIGLDLFLVRHIEAICDATPRHLWPPCAGSSGRRAYGCWRSAYLMALRRVCES